MASSECKLGNEWDWWEDQLLSDSGFPSSLRAGGPGSTTASTAVLAKQQERRRYVLPKLSHIPCLLPQLHCRAHSDCGGRNAFLGRIGSTGGLEVISIRAVGREFSSNHKIFPFIYTLFQMPSFFFVVIMFIISISSNLTFSFFSSASSFTLNLILDQEVDSPFHAASSLPGYSPAVL